MNLNTPPVFGFSVESIGRGRGPVLEGDGSYTIGDCDHIGFIEIQVESDGELDPCDYGFYVYEQGDSVPEKLVPRHPIQPRRQGDKCLLTLNWSDGASWTHEIIDFEMEFEAVSNFLYKGDRSSKLRVFHDGMQDH